MMLCGDAPSLATHIKPINHHEDTPLAGHLHKISSIKTPSRSERRSMKMHKVTLSSAALVLASLSHTTTLAFSPTAPLRSSRQSTLLRSSNPFDDAGATPDQPKYVENSQTSTSPGIQAIQPGMHEPDFYPEPIPTSIQPTDGRSDEDDGRQYGFRVYNGGPMSRTSQEQQATPRSDTTSLLREERPPWSQDHVRIQGNSLRTYSNPVGDTETRVDLSTQGRPIQADLQMWSGPNNTPKKVQLYSQDGRQYGVSTSFSATSGSQQTNAVSVRNEANMEFPLTTRVTSSPSPSLGPSIGSNVGAGMGQPYGGTQPQQQQEQKPPRAIQDEGGILMQGEGMVRTFPIAPNVQSVQVILQSAGSSGSRRLPVVAKVELLQGPNNVKTTADIYDDGMHGDYFETVMDTPGYTSSLRITNTGPMTYPFYALVVPYTFGEPRPLDNENSSGITSSRFGPDGRFRG